MTIRNKLLLAVLGFSTLGISSLTGANTDQSDVVFQDGSVLIRCASGQEINDELFNAAFPNWIKSLQQHADDGLIRRAHYLGKLKEGIFIVVAGDSREQAAENAQVVLSDLTAVAEAAGQATGVESSVNPENTCQTTEIGPVAILPSK